MRLVLSRSGNLHKCNDTRRDPSDTGISIRRNHLCAANDTCILKQQSKPFHLSVRNNVDNGQGKVFGRIRTHLQWSQWHLLYLADRTGNSSEKETRNKWLSKIDGRGIGCKPRRSRPVGRNYSHLQEATENSWVRVRPKREAGNTRGKVDALRWNMESFLSVSTRSKTSMPTIILKYYFD